jgi:hypothetical protein
MIFKPRRNAYIVRHATLARERFCRGEDATEAIAGGEVMRSLLVVFL